MKRIRPKAYEIEISSKILERMLCAVIQWLVFSAAYSLEFGSLKMVGEVLSIEVINRYAYAIYTKINRTNFN